MNRVKMATMGAMVLVCAVMASFAQEKKAAALKEAASSEIGEMRLRTMAPITCLCGNRNHVRQDRRRHRGSDAKNHQGGTGW